jgi:hypothetical protein
LKCAVVFGLRKLLDTAKAINEGKLSSSQGRKIITDEVCMAGDLGVNHIMAVAVLARIMWPRQCLTEPIIAGTLCNAVRKKVFGMDKKMTTEPIRKAAAQAGEICGLQPLVSEHLLCEGIKNGPGLDCFSPDQSFYWISTMSNADGTIFELPVNGEWCNLVRRSEDDDQQVISQRTLGDHHEHIFHWWLGEGDRLSSLIQYVKDCECNGEDPFALIHCTTKGASEQSKDEGVRLFVAYMDQHKMNLSDLPKKTAAQVQAWKDGQEVGFKKTTSKRLSASHKTSFVLGANHSKSSPSLQNAVANTTGPHLSGPHSSTIAQRAPSKETIINLFSTAETFWMAKYGRRMPKVDYDWQSGTGSRAAWCPKLSGGGSDVELKETSTFPPCAAIKKEVELVSGRGVGFRNKKSAKMAMWWSVIMTVPDLEMLVNWAGSLLGTSVSVDLYTDPGRKEVFARLGREGETGLYVQYNSRKHWIQRT